MPSAGYGVVAAALGARLRLVRLGGPADADADRVMRPAKALFAYSLLYLFAIFAIYLADSVAARAWLMREPELERSWTSRPSSRPRPSRRRAAAATSRSRWRSPPSSCSSTWSSIVQASAPPCINGSLTRASDVRQLRRSGRRNARTGSSPAICVAFFGGMVGMAYAAVPLYAMFCQMTGYGGTTQRVDAVFRPRARPQDHRCASTPTCSSACRRDFQPVQRDIDHEDRRDGAGALPRDQPVRHGRPTGRATFNVHAGDRRLLLQQGRVLLLHRHDAEARRERSICRSSSMSIRISPTCRN